MFIIILFTFLGGRVVLRGRSHPIIVGFMIGFTFMLAELLFVIMCIFFGLGTEAVNNGWGKTLLLLLIYLLKFIHITFIYSNCTIR